VRAAGQTPEWLLPLAVVLCRPPDSPAVKTRLARTVGRVQAQAFYRECLRHVLTVMRELPVSVRLTVAGRPLALAGLCAEVDIDVELVRQLDVEFAARQAHEITRGLGDHHPVVLLCASDLPRLRPEAVHWAVDLASEGDVAVVPSQDGGYSLLATAQPLPELAAVPMSLGDTGRRLAAALEDAGRRARVAPFAVRDVDVVDDAAALLAESAHGSVPGVPSSVVGTLLGYPLGPQPLEPGLERE